MAFHLYEYEHSSIRDIYHGFWHYAPLNILAIAFNFCRAHCQLMAKNSVLPNLIATLSTVRLIICQHGGYPGYSWLAYQAM